MRRLMGRVEHFLPVPVGDVMNRTPKLARAGDLASSAGYQMEKYGIMAMPVLDETDRLVGVVHLHDLMRARVV